MEEHTKGPVLLVDLHRHALAPCVKVYISMKFFPESCRKYEVSYTADQVSIMGKCGSRLLGHTVGTFLLLTADLRNLYKNDLETTEAILFFLFS